MVAAARFPDFEYSVTEVFKYINILKDFTLMLHNGDIVKFTPDDECVFKAWLDDNGVLNIRKESDWVMK